MKMPVGGWSAPGPVTLYRSERLLSRSDLIYVSKKDNVYISYKQSVDGTAAETNSSSFFSPIFKLNL